MASKPNASSKGSRAWPLWQYVAIIIMAVGVLGIGYAMFRPPVATDGLLGLKDQPAPVASGMSAPVLPENEAAASPLNKTSGDSAKPSEPSGTAPSNAASAVPEKQRSKVRGTANETSDAAPEHNDQPSSSQQSATPKPAKTATSAAKVVFSTLHIRVEHHLAEAQVFIWIDDKLAYTRELGGTVKKHLVVFRGIDGFQSESLHVTAGDHRIRVRVQSADDSYDQTGNIAGDFPQDGERALRIACDKHKLKLTLE